MRGFLKVCQVSRRPRHRGFPLSRAGGFTLVELLVVIGIIAVLIGMLLPTLSRANAQSLFLKCKSNMYQQLAAHHSYRITYKGYKPPLFRKGSSPPPRVDWVSPATKWSNQPVGQGLLVSEGLPFEMLLCPSEAMADDNERDRTSWLTLPDSGSSYAYFWRHPVDAPADPARACVGAKYDRETGAKRTALIMDVNADQDHRYTGEYAGRPWVSHPVVKLLNVGYVDGSVVSYPIEDVKLLSPGGQAEELQWFDAAHARR